MVFSSPIFIFIFLPLFLFCYFMTVVYGNIKHQNACLIIFSLIFYAYGGIRFLPILIFSIFINYILAIYIDKADGAVTRRFLILIDIFFNVLVLVIFKYLNLFDNLAVSLVNALFHRNYIDFIPDIALPIGISFYTFQIMTYVIDVYRNKVQVNYNFFQVLLYAMLFPQLIAGPIVRYSDVQNEISYRKTSIDNAYLGIKRFMIGFAKKILFANYCGNIATLCLNAEAYHIGFLFGFFAIVCYTIQIYLDFSAYSDMAIGIGKILGFSFPENFNDPFISYSLTEFWKKWHITLTSFLTDYIYIPLGGSRKGVFRTYVNIFIVFALSGIWHGANINYLLWGIYNALFMILEKLFLSRVLKKIPKFLSLIYTNLVWIFGMVIFYYVDFNKMFLYLDTLRYPIDLNYNFRPMLKAVLNYSSLVMFIICILLCTPIYKNICSFLQKKNLSFVADIIIVLLFVYAIMEMSVSGYNPFIYFRF